MLDYVEDEYSYDHHTKYPNSSKEIDYTPSKTINRNGEMEQPGFYATQNEENNLHNNMPMYTGYLSDELEEELNYQNLRYEPGILLHNVPSDTLKSTLTKTKIL